MKPRIECTLYLLYICCMFMTKSHVWSIFNALHFIIQYLKHGQHGDGDDCLGTTHQLNTVWNSFVDIWRNSMNNIHVV